MSSRGSYVYGGKLYEARRVLSACELAHLDEREEYAEAFCFDPLCEHDSPNCKAFIGGAGTLCVREIGGTAAVFAAGGSGSENEEEKTAYKITRFDTDTLMKRELARGIPDPIETLCVTDEYVVFTVRQGGRHALRACPANGAKTLWADALWAEDKPEGADHRLLGCVGENVYYYDEAGNVWETTVTFEKAKILFTGILPYGYLLWDGYLYFPYNLSAQEIQGYTDCFTFSSADLFRTPLSAPSIENSEAVARGVYTSYNVIAARFFEGKLYWSPLDAEYFGTVEYGWSTSPDAPGAELAGGSMIDTMIRSTASLYETDPRTLEATEVLSDLGYNTVNILYAGPEYVLFQSSVSGYRTDVPYDPMGAQYVYDRTTAALIRYQSNSAEEHAGWFYRYLDLAED
jgi:hypothetical protein